MKKNLSILLTFFLFQFISLNSAALKESNKFSIGIVDDKDYLLEDAIRKNNLKMIERAIGEGVKIKISEIDISEIFKKTDSNLLVRLLFYGLNPYEKDTQNKNVFDWAKESLSWEELEESDTDRERLKGLYKILYEYKNSLPTILNCIQYNEELDLIKLIHEKPYLLNSPFEYGNLLYFSITFNECNLFKLLLRLGANPNYSFISKSGKKFNSIYEYIGSDNFKNNKQIQDKDKFQRFLREYCNPVRFNEFEERCNLLLGIQEKIVPSLHEHINNSDLENIILEYLI